MSERKPFSFRIYRALRAIAWPDHILLQAIGHFYQDDTISLSVKLRSLRATLRNDLATVASIRASYGHDWKGKP